MIALSTLLLAVPLFTATNHLVRGMIHSTLESEKMAALPSLAEFATA